MAITIDRVDENGNVNLSGQTDDDVRAFLAPILEGFVDARAKGTPCSITMKTVSDGDRYAGMVYTLRIGNDL